MGGEYIDAEMFSNVIWLDVVQPGLGQVLHGDSGARVDGAPK